MNDFEIFIKRRIRYENTIEIAANPAGLVDNRDFNLCPGTGSCCGCPSGHRQQLRPCRIGLSDERLHRELNCFGKFEHYRKPYDVDNQVTVRGNRDTLYSFGVFDLRSPLTVTLPETEGRYQSLMIVSQDHSIWGLYGPKTGTLTEEKVGTRYVFLVIRTFMDPNDEKDMKAAHRLQDAVSVKQADIGKFEVPNWKKDEVEQMRDTINVVASTVTDAVKDVRQERGVWTRSTGCWALLSAGAGCRQRPPVT